MKFAGPDYIVHAVIKRHHILLEFVAEAVEASRKLNPGVSRPPRTISPTHVFARSRVPTGIFRDRADVGPEEEPTRSAAQPRAKHLQ